MSVRVGVLLRHEDESGVSGTGIVADIFEYPDGMCVMHWRSSTPSTNIYPNTKAMQAVHGHGGKTEIVFYADLASPRSEEELAELLAHHTITETAQREREQLLEEVTEEVVEEMKDDILELAAERAARVVDKRSKRTASKAARATEGDSA
jgi:hypothetical protein